MDNNFTEAFMHFNRSAQSGNSDGLYNAALLLRDGRGLSYPRLCGTDLRRPGGVLTPLCVMSRG